MAEQGNEEKKTIQFSVNLPKSLIGLGSEVTQAIRDPFLVFLIVLVLSIPVMLWLLSEHMEHFRLLYTYIAVVVAFAILGMWAHRATVRRERDRLLEERDDLADKFRDTWDKLQCCLEQLLSMR